MGDSDPFDEEGFLAGGLALLLEVFLVAVLLEVTGVGLDSWTTVVGAVRVGVSVGMLFVVFVGMKFAPIARSGRLLANCAASVANCMSSARLSGSCNTSAA